MNLFKDLAYGAFVIATTVGTIAVLFVVLAGGYAAIIYGFLEVMRAMVAE